MSDFTLDLTPGPTVSLVATEPKKWLLPFRGGTLSVWPDTDPGTLAIIAQLSLEDPRFDAFYKAAGVTLKDAEGRVVFPLPDEQAEEGVEEGGPPDEDLDVFDMFS